MTDKKSDRAKIEAALKRAARTAVTGSREARSGKFLAASATMILRKPTQVATVRPRGK